MPTVLHTVWLDTGDTDGVGLTVIVKLFELPIQPFASGVTVTIAVTATLPLLMAVNDGILPVPVAAKPMPALLFVQLYTLPLTEPVNTTGVVDAVLHTV